MGEGQVAGWWLGEEVCGAWKAPQKTRESGVAGDDVFGIFRQALKSQYAEHNQHINDGGKAWRQPHVISHLLAYMFNNFLWIDVFYGYKNPVASSALKP